MTCRTCEYYELTKLSEGLCRRMPPTPVAVPMQDQLGRTVITIQAFFPPVVADTKKCGEYRLKMETGIIQ